MDITRIFKSKARKALFRLYFTNPDKSYYLRELERELKTPVSIIRKELIALEKEGIFASTKKGNLLYYGLNKAHPFFSDLKNIVFKTIGVQGALKELLSSLQGIRTAFIYGSYAKNQDSVKSDIDLFIIGDIDEDTLVTKINKLEKALKREINYSLYSKDDFTKKKKQRDPFVEDVLENKKIYIIGGDDDI